MRKQFKTELDKLKTLEEFDDWFIEKWRTTGCIPFFPPNDPDIVSTYSTTTSLILLRYKSFQAQLTIAKASEDWNETPEHRHPDVWAIEHYVAGDVEFTVEGESRVPRHLTAYSKRNCPLNTPLLQMKKCLVPPSVKHQFTPGPRGAAFITTQMWARDMKPTLISLNWAGKALNKDHEIKLGRRDED